MTPFYPKRTLSINVAFSRLERELFRGWTLFLSGKKTTVKNSEGKEVCFAGNVEFAGSMRELFWNGFFEADFKKIIKEQIDQTLKDCESHHELAKAALNETADLLREFSRKVYDRMAEIDQRIRGNGDPNMTQRQAVVDKVKALNTDIEALTEAAKKQLKSSRPWHWLSFFSSRPLSSVR